MRFDKLPAMLKRFRAAALALPIALGLAAPAAAEPRALWTEAISLQGGRVIDIPAGGVFDDFGTRPRYTDVTWSTTRYLDTDGTGFSADPTILRVTVLTNEALNELDPQPPNPFTFTATVTLTNDEDETASAELTFSAVYAATSGEAATSPTFSHTNAITAIPGVKHTVRIDRLFVNPGTNPKFVVVDFSSHIVLLDESRTGLPDDSGGADIFTVAVKTEDELRALASPPPNVFSFEADVSMTNDEDQTASGRVTFQTEWNIAPLPQEQKNLKPGQMNLTPDS